MASSSGNSSASSLFPNSGSDEDQRKRKRMLSNRESARRSRMRKQKHLDDLMALVAQLRKENGQIFAGLGVTTQHYLGVETENSVLRTQMMELSNRLQSLNEILQCLNVSNTDDGFIEPWNLMFMNQPHPIMASADMFQY